ncbi:hypothetical protein HYC85_024979 [Camellia sinensis]|uniref:Uncharacterized protein n=1 Tax=Camellia sinensis TaxID=4442 RepID=A0A7J7G9P2_CAMSI|nr:hypothetical protein HYC85_024979 [Camellia sinensis]
MADMCSSIRGHNMCTLLSGPLFTLTVVECIAFYVACARSTVKFVSSYSLIANCRYPLLPFDAASGFILWIYTHLHRYLLRECLHLLFNHIKLAEFFFFLKKEAIMAFLKTSLNIISTVRFFKKRYDGVLKTSLNSLVMS